MIPRQLDTVYSSIQPVDQGIAKRGVVIGKEYCASGQDLALGGER